MKLSRMPYETGAVLDFYADGLTALGALCERPWHDRLEVAAEGRAATLWDPAGALYAGSAYHAWRYTTPTGVACDYKLMFPEDDP